jgi:hypothetical protein
MTQQVPICENNSSISDPPSSDGASTSLSLNVPRHERAEMRTTAFDLNSAEEDDGRADVSSASGAGTRPFPAAAPAELQPSHHHGPAGAGHGHHCSPLDLELSMSLSTPSVGT